MKRIAIILTAMLGMSGCATTLTSIPPDHTLGPGDESIVVGRVTLDLDRPPVAFLANLGRMKLTVTNETTEKDYAVWCDTAGLDSAFYVPLPPGRYRFVSVHAMNVVSQLPPGRFDVEPARVQYVGTLRFRGISGTALTAFRERYPRIAQPVAMPKPEAWRSLGPAAGAS